MAVPVITNVSRTLVSVDQGAHTARYELVGHCDSAYAGAETVTFKFQTRIGAGSYTDWTPTTPASASTPPNINADFIYSTVDVTADESSSKWRSVGVGSVNGTVNASELNYKSAAVTAVADTPTSSSVSYTTATIACDYYPNTNDSKANVYLQYKRAVDVTWTTAETQTDQQGYAALSISKALTGLTAGTQYNVRLWIDRNTINEKTLYSATASFTTLTAAPTVTTAAATSIGTVTAQLNATVAVNGATGLEVYWDWDTVNPPSASNPNYGVSAAQSVASDGSYNTIATGLSSNTLYYFRAAITWSPSSYSAGSVLNFTTLSAPPAGSEEELVDIFTFYGKYGVATTLTFTLRKPAATSSDLVYVSTAPVQADCLVFKDGVYDDTSDNAPAQVSTYLYTLQLSATEMQADVVDVVIHDADATAFRDCHLRVITALNLGNVSIDADARSDNKPGLYARGDGSGAGAQFVGGATGNDITGILGDMVQRESTCQAGSAAGTIVLDASASASNDYYNGAIVLVYSGVGAGQARVITDYVGATQTCTVNKNWATTPDNTSKFIILPGDDPWKVASAAQLASLPTVTSNYADMLQFVFQRFALKRTQTATEFKSYKSDGTTALGTGSVTDDGTTQTHGALS